MDDMDQGTQDAVVTDVPSPEMPDGQTAETPEAELTDEELKLQIETLKEEAKKEVDPKEKRHKEQEAGWSEKVLRERERAQNLAKENDKAQASMKEVESTLIEETYSKIIDENFGLPYLEKLYATKPEIADKVTKEKWGKSAKDLILETKRTHAENGDEDAKKHVNTEEIRAQVYHDVAIENAQSLFDDLSGTEKEEAKAYFADMSDGKLLTTAKAKQFAEMAVMYATRNRKAEDKPADKPVDKDRAIADKASTNISSKTGSSKETVQTDVEAVRNQLLSAGISRYQVDLMYPIN